MIDRQQATIIMEEWLAAHPVISAAGPVELCLLDEDTIELDFGWVFFYTTKLYRDTGDFRYTVGGNAPMIVDRDSKSLHITGTVYPTDFYINQYRSLKASECLIQARRESGLTVEGDIFADVHLFSAKEGGRYSASSPTFLACIFEVEAERFDCRLLLEEVGSLQPGATASIPIKFILPMMVVPLLNVGSKFRLRDYRIIGEGRVLAIWPNVS